MYVEKRRRRKRERHQGMLGKSTGFGVREIWIHILALLFIYLLFLSCYLLISKNGNNNTYLIDLYWEIKEITHEQLLTHSN